MNEPQDMTTPHLVFATATQSWTRTGLVMPRSSSGDGSDVVGDPCIVWDPEVSAWRMVLFFDPPGHADSISEDPTGAPGSWSPPRPLRFTNPDALPAGGGTHKPFVVMDIDHPNHAALVDNRYWLLTISFTGRARQKRVQRAWARSLRGPWTLEPGALIDRGSSGSFDENHVDAVSGFWLPRHQEFWYFYMGYPLAPQPWPGSPYGNAIGVATQRLGEPAVKRGVALAPSPQTAPWVAGYLGGLQLMPGADHRWVGLINGSPTPPDRRGTLTSEEPAPSLGGVAYCNAELPLSGWTVSQTPLESMSELPAAAVAAGEGVNFWRHHLLQAPGMQRLFYNSGSYGHEQMYSKERPAG